MSYISTKTQSLKVVGELPMSFPELFWHVPLVPYMQPREGAVKKELRVELKTEEEVCAYEAPRDAYQAAHPDIAVREMMYRKKFVRVGICQKEL